MGKFIVACFLLTHSVYCTAKHIAGRVLFQDAVKLLGVTLDSALTMDRHDTDVLQVPHTCTAAHPTASDTSLLESPHSRSHRSLSSILADHGYSGLLFKHGRPLQQF